MSIDGVNGIQKSLSFINLLIFAIVSGAEGCANIDLLPNALAPNSSFPVNLATISPFDNNLAILSSMESVKI